MEFLENYLKDKCLTCKICCRFPERHSPLIPFFLDKEIGAYYGCRIDVIKSGNRYMCPYFAPSKNSCSIYHTRPIDCRLYPFMITYDSSYKKVILVLDNNCPYSKELICFKDDTLKYINSIEITPQNLGFVNDPQPNTTFIEELFKLTEFIFGIRRGGGGFRKLTLEDRIVIPYLWKDIMNVLYEEETREIYYGLNGDFKKLPKDNKEYIYLKKDLIELKGDKYKDKRNLCNYFQKNYSYKVEKMTSDSSAIEECLSLYKKWSENKIKKDNNSYYQQLIEDSFFFHRRALLDFNKLELSGIIVKIDKKLAGYTFGCRLSDDTFCILGEITDLNFKGINQFIFKEFCKNIPDNYIYINTMDDSEIEGLRKNKLSYHPITKL